MAHLWVEDAAHGWAVVALDGEESIELGQPQPHRLAADEAIDDDAVVLTREPRAGRSEWVLIAGTAARVRVNGLHLAGGIRVMQDRDEIRVAGTGHHVLSTVSPARIEPHPEADRVLRCPRCTLEIAVGSPTVQCPGCAVRYHESREYPCWTYARACSLCRHRTVLDGSFPWTPERCR